LSGIFYSLIANSIVIYIVELFPAKARSKLMVFLLSSYSMGRVLGSVIVWATLQPYQWGLWRLPLVIATGLLSIAFPGMLIFVKESVRFNFMKGRLGRAHYDFSAIQDLNLDKTRESSLEKILRFSELTQLHEINILEASNSSPDTTPAGAIEGQVLRKKLNWMIGYFFLTVVMLCCIAVGHSLAISNLLGSNERTLELTVAIMCGEFVAVAICATLVDHPMVGRKRLIKGGLILSGLIFLTASFFKGNVLSIFLFFTKITVKCALSMVFIHQAETIPSHVRDKVLPLVSAASEATLMLYIPFFFQTVKWGEGSVLSILALFCAVGTFGAHQLQDDLEEARLKKEEDKNGIKN